MLIERSTVTKLVITEAPALDPITVYFEDLGETKHAHGISRQGKVLLECYGKSWSTYWGGMGNATVAEFFCSCDAHYIGTRMFHGETSVYDFEALSHKAKKEVLRRRRFRHLTEVEARDMYDGAEDFADVDHPELLDASLVEELFEGQWFEIDIPTKPSRDYAYLIRIIEAVQQALSQELKAVA